MGMRPGLGLRNGGAGRGAEPLRHRCLHLPGLLAASRTLLAHTESAAAPVKDASAPTRSRKIHEVLSEAHA